MRKPIANDLCGHQNSKKIHTILISYSWPLYKGIASQPTRTGEIITTIVRLKLGLNILPNVCVHRQLRTSWTHNNSAYNTSWSPLGGHILHSYAQVYSIACCSVEEAWTQKLEVRRHLLIAHTYTSDDEIYVTLTVDSQINVKITTLSYLCGCHTTDSLAPRRQQDIRRCAASNVWPNLMCNLTYSSVAHSLYYTWSFL